MVEAAGIELSMNNVIMPKITLLRHLYPAPLHFGARRGLFAVVCLIE